MRKSFYALATTALALTLCLLLGCSSGREGVPDAGATGAAAADGGAVAADASAASAESADGGADGTTAASVVDATSEHVRLVGRTCEADGVTWLPQSGSAVEFRVSGTSAKVEVVGDGNVHEEPAHRPRYAVLVDGKVVADEVLGEESRVVEVLRAPSPTTGVVEVMHLSEARYGAVGVKSIAIESDAAEPVVPTAARDLSIEFIGDSITCGYGVEATGNDDPFRTGTQNFMCSYAYLAAQALGADYSAVCYSGFGIVSGWSGDSTRNADMLLPPLYDVVAKGYEQAWGFSAHPSDVVVINLGTNDATYTGTDEARMREFAQGYEAFLSKVRERNPDAHIVCTMGTMGGHELYPYVAQAVADFRKQTGDERAMCYLSQAIDVEADGVGTNGHPNRASQQKCADRLVEVIRQVLGK